MQKLTEKRPFSNHDLLALLLPLVIEQLLNMTVGLADSMMVSQIGEAAVSAVSMVDSVNVLLNNMLTALATGGAIVMGHYLGAKEMERTKKTAEQLLLVVGTMSLVITAAIYLLRHFVIYVVFGSVEPVVAQNAELYFNVVELTIPFVAIYSAGAAMFRIMGDSKTPMRISVIMNLINVVGNAILIFGFHWDVLGVAVPTLVSRVFAAVTILLLLCSPKLAIRLDRSFRLSFDRELVGKIVRTGVPNGVEGAIFQLGKVMLISLVSTLGTSALTSFSIGNTIGIFQLVTGQAIAIGTITVISRCVGLGDYDLVRYYTKKLIAWAYLSMFVVNILILLVLPVILNIYNVTDATRELTQYYIVLHGVMTILLWSLSFILPATLRASGDVVYAMVVACLSMWIFRLGLATVLVKVFDLGIFGVWYAMFADWIVRIICFVVRYRGERWKKKVI